MRWIRKPCSWWAGCVYIYDRIILESCTVVYCISIYCIYTYKYTIIIQQNRITRMDTDNKLYSKIGPNKKSAAILIEVVCINFSLWLYKTFQTTIQISLTEYRNCLISDNFYFIRLFYSVLCNFAYFFTFCVVE